MSDRGKSDSVLTPAPAASRWFLGETLGTFVLVLFGNGAVCAAVLSGAHHELLSVAALWGLGVALAIYLADGLSGAHLNPAVTVALALWRGFPRRRVAGYVVAQLLGAFLAAATLHGLYRGPLAAHEAAAGVTRGAAGSEASATVFCEFFPNPAGKPLGTAARALVSEPTAFAAETLGTALLVFAVFGLTSARNRTRPSSSFAPLAIGVVVTLLISVWAPLTQACFNPARDLGPRLWTLVGGWGTAAFTANGTGWLTVYVLAPLLGGVLGGFAARGVFDRGTLSEADPGAR